MSLHPYRSHTCGELTLDNVDEKVRLTGWVYRVRDLGGIVFIDLRDHYGITQVIINPDCGFYADVSNWKLESVITFTGLVLQRDKETVNSKLSTGEVELEAKEMVVQNWTKFMPFMIDSEGPVGEQIRLEHRYLDLRQSRLHNNILIRSKIIAFLRSSMTEKGFNEFQTPILTSSSPEGARDFLVPSRLHPGKFYALPQAPQQFKQLLMVSGFDKYFQVAPCFRDEDARADRSPGEFYQLDIEMSFITQDDLFTIVEDVLIATFEKFTDWKSGQKEFIRIPFKEAMLKYGTDKPDLRNPLEICDVSEIFEKSTFKAFASCVQSGGVVRAIAVPDILGKPRSFHDKMIEYAQSIGSKGLAYLLWDEEGKVKSPIAKFLSDSEIEEIKTTSQAKNGGGVYFIADKEKNANDISGKVRTELGNILGLLDKKGFKFCWIIDFPMFEYDEENQKIEFSHNPFSMPQGEMDALLNEDPLTIKAYQYDLVCNGVELSSGAIRNHKPEIMYKAFEIAGYSETVVNDKFSGMINAFKHGAPPHGGIAPGIDRMVMLILDEPNIRESIAFPFNQQAMDLTMKAPSTIDERQLKELNLKIDLPQNKKPERNHS